MPERAALARIVEAVDARRDEIVEALVAAIRIPTQTPPGENYDLAVEDLLPRFREIGFQAHRHDLPMDVFEERCRRINPRLEGVRANLLATRSVTGRPQMGFYCHLDTMPVGDVGRWTVDPFGGELRDGYVWGRGSADSKAGCVAILHAFRVLWDLGMEPAVSPLVALTTDEESGPYTGLIHMADTGVFDRCRRFFSCDGMANSVAVGAQGLLEWTVRVRGRSCHSSSPFLGLNAIEHSRAAIEELLVTAAEVAGRRSRLRISPEMEAAAGRDRIAPVLNITMAHGGVKHNVIPDEFVIEGDRRYIPEEDEAECIREIEAALDRARRRDPLLDCELAVRSAATPLFSDPDDPWIVSTCRLASAIRGEPIVAAALSGGTDVALLAAKTGMKVAIHGQARFEDTRNHSPDERCRISDLLAMTKLVAALAVEAEPE